MVLFGDPFEYLDEKKYYMNPFTGAVYTGKGWSKVMDRSKYDVFQACQFKDFIEVKRNKKTKEWEKV